LKISSARAAPSPPVAAHALMSDVYEMTSGVRPARL